MNKINNVRHPDYTMFDEVRIITSERWKESEMSGDEWRFSYRIEWYFKAHMVKYSIWGSLQGAIMAIGHDYLMAGDDGVSNQQIERERYMCAQPGCGREASVFFRVKAEYDRSGVKTELPPSYNPDRLYVIGFCGKHTHRGDCGLQDADANYEQIPNPYAAAT